MRSQAHTHIMHIFPKACNTTLNHCPSFRHLIQQDSETSSVLPPPPPPLELPPKLWALAATTKQEAEREKKGVFGGAAFFSLSKITFRLFEYFIKAGRKFHVKALRYFSKKSEKAFCLFFREKKLKCLLSKLSERGAEGGGEGENHKMPLGIYRSEVVVNYYPSLSLSFPHSHSLF